MQIIKLKEKACLIDEHLALENETLKKQVEEMKATSLKFGALEDQIETLELENTSLKLQV